MRKYVVVSTDSFRVRHVVEEYTKRESAVYLLRALEKVKETKNTVYDVFDVTDSERPHNLLKEEK